MSDDSPFGRLPDDGGGVDPGWEPPAVSPPQPPAGQPGLTPPAPGVPYPGPGPGGDHPVPPGHPHGHGTPFPSQPPAAAAPARRRRGCLWLAIGIPLLALAGIGGCTALVVFSVRGPIDATNRFVADLDDGRLDDAFDRLCAAEQASLGRDGFGADIDRRLGGEITGYRFTEASVTGTGGSQRAVVSGTIDIDGSSESFSFELVREDDQWRICG